MGNKKPCAAFFDLDNTLIQGSSLYYFFKGLVDFKLVSKKQILHFAFENFRFVRSKTENSASMARIGQKALNLVAGRSHLHLVEACEAIVESFLTSKLNHHVLERVQEHKLLGHDTWLVTAAPMEIAEAVSRQIGMTGGLGTRSEITDGKFSGKLINEMLHGVHKARVLQDLSQKHNYDLQRSFAYSDSVNDLPMLLSVGNPLVVNPNEDLARIARKNSWVELTRVA